MRNPIHFKKFITLTLVGTILGAGFYHEILNEKIIESAAAKTIENKERILTVADFSGHGRNDQNLREIPNMRVSIHPEVALFTFDIVSFVEQPNWGTITISQNNVVTQTIKLEDPNMFLADKIHNFFNVVDINFDGYADIGVLEEGGAKWGAYQYWIYDKNINQFVKNNFTADFRKLNFNEIIFDEAKKQIRTNNFCGTLICDKDIYVIKNNELVLLEAHHQEQPYNASGIEEKCEVTITKYQDNKEKTATTNLKTACPGYYREI